MEPATQLQHYWSDNQVSCTAEIDLEREANQIPRILEAYGDRLKAIGFLPTAGDGYKQPPYEAISRQHYEESIARLKPWDGPLHHEQEQEARFCESGICELR